MANITSLASKRNGTTAGCAPGSRRFSITLSEKTFLALRDRADANHHGLSGEAAAMISDLLTLEGRLN